MSQVYYIEHIGDELFDRPAVVLGEAERCAICHEGAATHSRPNRRHSYTAESGLALRVTFPAGRRRKLPEEVVDYAFVLEGTEPNQWHR